MYTIRLGFTNVFLSSLEQITHTQPGFGEHEFYGWDWFCQSSKTKRGKRKEGEQKWVSKGKQVRERECCMYFSYTVCASVYLCGLTMSVRLHWQTRFSVNGDDQE